jgi:hypothetical protein
VIGFQSDVALMLLARPPAAPDAPTVGRHHSALPFRSGKITLAMSTNRYFLYAIVEQRTLDPKRIRSVLPP